MVRRGPLCCAHWSADLSMTAAILLEFGYMSSLGGTAITSALPPASVYQNPLFPVDRQAQALARTLLIISWSNVRYPVSAMTIRR